MPKAEQQKLSIKDRINLLSVVGDVIDECNDKKDWAQNSYDGYVKQKEEAGADWYDYNERWLVQSKFKVDIWNDIIQYLNEKY